jgi:hypothetical protein
MITGRQARRKQSVGRPKCRWEDTNKKYFKDVEWNSVHYIHLARDRACSLNTGMNSRVSLTEGNSLTIWGTISLLRTTLRYGVRRRPALRNGCVEGVKNILAAPKNSQFILCPSLRKVSDLIMDRLTIKIRGKIRRPFQSDDVLSQFRTWKLSCIWALRDVRTIVS